MKLHETRPLADDVATRVDQARLARQWSAVSGGLAKRPRRRSFFAVFAPAALVVLATIAVLIARPWRADPTGSQVRAGRASEVTVLPDGSRVTLSSGAEMVLESATRERVHIILGAGEIDLDVTHVEGRPFIVTAAGHDVTVLGTAFGVKLVGVDGQRTLGVEVTRGRVRVTGPTGEHVLDAGQSWSARIEEAVRQPSAGDGSSTTSATAALAPEGAPGSVDSALPSGPTSSLAVAPQDGSEAPPATNPSGRAAGTAAAAPLEGPRELLARATEARTAGRPRDAAIALNMLRKQYRSDARAGLAAFELGRIRMDALHDPAGAAEAFADAVALAPSSPFREDADARRVEALEALPDRAGCERARDAYLTRYPSGLHAKQIAQRCKRP